MPAIAFPNIKPTGRSYTPGSYPKTSFVALNGATTFLRYGGRRNNSELALDFANISDANAALILANYEQQNAGDNWVTFTPANGSAGASAELAAYLGETASGLRFRYDSPPSVSSVVPGRSTVSIKLIGYLDG